MPAACYLANVFLGTAGGWGPVISLSAYLLEKAGNNTCSLGWQWGCVCREDAGKSQENVWEMFLGHKNSKLEKNLAATKSALSTSWGIKKINFVCPKRKEPPLEILIKKELAVKACFSLHLSLSLKLIYASVSKPVTSSSVQSKNLRFL